MVLLLLLAASSFSRWLVQADKALEVYKLMRASNTRGSPECYTAAVHACSQKGDLDSALSVFDDLKKDGVRPDEVEVASQVVAEQQHSSLIRWFSCPYYAVFLGKSLESFA